MATEEVNKPPSLPQYPEMIMTAISALNDKDGSSKSSISEYIETQYGDLPAGHSMLLAHHLDKMKENGELVLVQDLYVRPNPNDPPKRGRGRPPKPKAPVPSGVVPPPPRPRGRPPKAKNSLATASAKAAAGMPKPRGRPPKKARPAGVASSAPLPAGVKRGRGRPPKVKPPFATVGFD